MLLGQMKSFSEAIFCRINKISHVLSGDAVVGGGGGYKPSLLAPTPTQFEMYWIR